MRTTYELPASTRLGPVKLRVSELARSAAYYRDILGFDVVADDQGTARVSVTGSDAPLIELYEHPGAAPSPGRGRLGLYHFAILLPDRTALGRFVGHLAQRGVRVGAADHLVSEALYLQDPDNLGIEVYADRPRSTWTRRDGELVMASDPLDVPSLLESAGGKPWTGMPAGTTLGHIHLHVGDLGRAEEFYGAGVGLAPVARSYPAALFLAAGGYHHHLGVNTWAGPGASPPADSDAALLEWTLVLPSMADVDEAAANLVARGFTVERAPDGWRALDPWQTPLRVRSA